MKVVKLFVSYMKKLYLFLWFLSGVRSFVEIKLTLEVTTLLANDKKPEQQPGWYVDQGFC